MLDDISCIVIRDNTVITVVLCVVGIVCESLENEKGLHFYRPSVGFQHMLKWLSVLQDSGSEGQSCFLVSEFHSTVL